MGVPGFFGWLIRKYKNNNIVIPQLNDDQRVHSLFIDANCLFHPQCFKVLGHTPNWKTVSTLENKMIKRILNYIDYLIEVTSPTDMVMISVDGVAPTAKMSQQRKRRFRSLTDARDRSELRKKHGLDVEKPWSNIVITPGTIFMEKLHKELNKYIKKRKGVKILYSSYHSCGEGEHKILKYIKDSIISEQSMDNIYVVYGLDADLIFLSIASQRKNMYLLREYDQFQKTDNKVEILDIVEEVEEELRFVSIDEMKLLFFSHFKRISQNILGNIKGSKPNLTILFDQSKMNNMLNDFVVICFFLGNDFLPHIPSVDIQVNGLDMVIEAYLNTYLITTQNLVVLKPNVHLNTNVLKMFLGYIAKREDYYFKNILPKYKSRMANRECRSSNPYDKEVWDIENIRNIKVTDHIRLGEDDPELWRHRYYSHHFNIKFDQASLINKVAYHFLRGVMWVLKYYFEECPSWNWTFPYMHAPFISDIHNILKNNKIDINSIIFEDTGPLDPCEQLLAVLPPECNHLLPISYQHLVKSIDSPIIDLYPTSVILDMQSQDKYWKCSPIIPNVDTIRIKNAAKGLTLTPVESIRNVVI